MSEVRVEHIVDFPHFTKDRKLSSCLTIDPAEKGVFCSIVGNARPVGNAGNSKTTTLLNKSEIAETIMSLTKFYNDML